MIDYWGVTDAIEEPATYAVVTPFTKEVTVEEIGVGYGVDVVAIKALVEVAADRLDAVALIQLILRIIKFSMIRMN